MHAISGQPGTLDATGATTSPLGAGKLITPIGSSSDYANSLALQPDGKILVAGYCTNGTTDDFCLARYEAGPFDARNCSLDIDGDGRVLATTDSLIHARIALGITGPPVITGITFAANATRNTWPLIRDYLVTQCGLSQVPSPETSCQCAENRRPHQAQFVRWRAR